MTEVNPDYEVEENDPNQAGDHVEEAVPESEITATVSDMPVDYGDPGVADWPDPAFGEAEEEDDTPGEGEPDEEDDHDALQVGSDG